MEPVGLTCPSGYPPKTDMYGEAETARSRYLEVAQGCTARDLDGNTVAGPRGQKERDDGEEVESLSRCCCCSAAHRHALASFALPGSAQIV